MSIHIDALRDIAANHGWPVCDEAADEIEELEMAYALLFKENGKLAEACLAAIAGKAELLEALTKIAAIEDKMVGHDWEEIEQAREIARSAIAKHSKEQEA